MAYSKPIVVVESHTVVGLKVKGEAEFISEDIGELPADEEYECQCPICQKYITEHQYKNGKVVSTDESNPIYWFAHKECIEKKK